MGRGRGGARASRNGFTAERRQLITDGVMNNLAPFGGDREMAQQALNDVFAGARFTLTTEELRTFSGREISAQVRNMSDRMAQRAINQGLRNVGDRINARRAEQIREIVNRNGNN